MTPPSRCIAWEYKPGVSAVKARICTSKSALTLVQTVKTFKLASVFNLHFNFDLFIYIGYYGEDLVRQCKLCERNCLSCIPAGAKTECKKCAETLVLNHLS